MTSECGCCPSTGRENMALLRRHCIWSAAQGSSRTHIRFARTGMTCNKIKNIQKTSLSSYRVTAGRMAPPRRDVLSVRERAESLSLGFCSPAPWPANPRSLDSRPALVGPQMIVPFRVATTASCCHVTARQKQAMVSPNILSRDTV